MGPTAETKGTIGHCVDSSQWANIGQVAKISCVEIGPPVCAVPYLRRFPWIALPCHQAPPISVIVIQKLDLLTYSNRGRLVKDRSTKEPKLTCRKYARLFGISKCKTLTVL